MGRTYRGLDRRGRFEEDEHMYMMAVSNMQVDECRQCHQVKQLDPEATIGFGEPSCRDCLEDAVSTVHEWSEGHEVES